MINKRGMLSIVGRGWGDMRLRTLQNGLGGCVAGGSCFCTHPREAIQRRAVRDVYKLTNGTNSQRALNASRPHKPGHFEQLLRDRHIHLILTYTSQMPNHGIRG